MPPQSPLPPRPKILHCVSHLALGGAERVALTLTEALCDEFDFEVYAVRGLGDGDVGRSMARELSQHHVPLHTGPRVPMRYGGMLTGAIGLARAIRRSAPDLIHLHTEIPEASYAAMVTILPWTRNIPSVRTIHNTVFWEFWRPLGLWCDRRMPDTLVAGVSPGAVEAFVQLRQESGVRPLPVKPLVIWNGVKPASSLATRAPRNPGRSVRIVFGGRLEYQKGTDLLPEILAQTRAPKPAGAHLFIYGSGAHEPVIRELAVHPPAGWKVELHAPTTDFARKLCNFDLMIMPSRYEGLGLVSIEGSLAGLPVIATDARGLKETLPECYPWLARVGDAASFASVLQQALDHPEQWLEVGLRAQAFAQKYFSVETMAASYRTLYRQALSFRHGSSSGGAASPERIS